MASGCDIGQLEAYIEKQLKDVGRPLLEEAVQKRADRQALSCPSCGRARVGSKDHDTGGALSGSAVGLFSSCFVP